MQAQLDFYEDLESQCDEAKDRLQKLKQELESYEALISLLKNHMNENINMQKHAKSSTLTSNSHNNHHHHHNHNHNHNHNHHQHHHNNHHNSSGNNRSTTTTMTAATTTMDDDNSRKLSILKESFDKLRAKCEHYKSLKIDREYDYQRKLTEKTQLETHLNSMKTQIAAIRKQQQEQELGDRRNNQSQDPAFDYDVETINFLNECNWNLGNSCDRGLAETLLECFPSGTFLVRSSKNKIDEEYCFHPPGPQRQNYSSLCDLVMDYRHKSLVKHNPELNTSLIYPVLSQLKKVGR